MISLFPTFCLFRFPSFNIYSAVLYLHVASCLPPTTAPTQPPHLPPAVTDRQTRVAATSTRIQTAAPFSEEVAGFISPFLPPSYRRACDSFDLVNYKIRIPPAKVDQISSFIRCVLRPRLCHHFLSAGLHAHTMQMRWDGDGARLVRSAPKFV